MMRPTANSRRFSATRRRNLAARPADLGLLEHYFQRLGLLFGAEDRVASPAASDRRCPRPSLRNAPDRARSRRATSLRAQARTARSRNDRPCRIRWVRRPRLGSRTWGGIAPDPVGRRPLCLDFHQKGRGPPRPCRLRFRNTGFLAAQQDMDRRQPKNPMRSSLCERSQVSRPARATVTGNLSHRKLCGSMSTTTRTLPLGCGADASQPRI